MRERVAVSHSRHVHGTTGIRPGASNTAKTWATDERASLCNDDGRVADAVAAAAAASDPGARSIFGARAAARISRRR